MLQPRHPPRVIRVPSRSLTCLLLAVSAACTSYAPMQQSAASVPGAPVRYPVREGDKLRITLHEPSATVPVAVPPDESQAAGPELAGQSAGQGPAVPDTLTWRCCHQTRVLGVGEEGLWGEDGFFPWEQIAGIEVAEPDHLKTAALVVTFPIWFPLGAVLVALTLPGAL